MNKDLKILIQYPEFYALKKELVGLVEKLEDIHSIPLVAASRITVVEELAGRVYAAKAIKDLLSNLGVIKNTEYANSNKTYE